jgi:hypothetical protein
VEPNPIFSAYYIGSKIGNQFSIGAMQQIQNVREPFVGPIGRPGSAAACKPKLAAGPVQLIRLGNPADHRAGKGLRAAGPDRRFGQKALLSMSASLLSYLDAA